jgi:cytoskeletal protein CcmA (bactofilin family)
MENIDLIFLFVIAAFIGYYFCKREQSNFDTVDGFEGFASIDDARQAVREVYNADIDAIRNLSTVATKLQAGGLTIPGNLQVNESVNVKGSISTNNPTWNGWISGNFGMSGKDRVVIGNLENQATVGAHNNALNAWTALRLQGDSINMIANNGNINASGNLRIKGTNFTSGDMVMNGGNNWLFHTPDDNRRTMYVAPSKAYGNEDWNWGASTEFNADGSIIVKGNIIAGGMNIVNEIKALQTQLNTLKGQTVKYDEKIRIGNSHRIDGGEGSVNNEWLTVHGGRKVGPWPEAHRRAVFWIQKE